MPSGQFMQWYRWLQRHPGPEECLAIHGSLIWSANTKKGSVMPAKLFLDWLPERKPDQPSQEEILKAQQKMISALHTSRLEQEREESEPETIQPEE